MESVTSEATINIIYECSGTQYGESVFLVGNIPLLGGWNIQNNFELKTNARIYPRWTIQLKVPTGITFEYKYLVANSNDHSITRWEVLPSKKRNRILSAIKPEPIYIYEREGMYEREIKYKNTSMNALDEMTSPTKNMNYLNTHSFGLINDFDTKLDEVKEDDSDDEIRIEDLESYHPPERVAPLKQNLMKNGKVEARLMYASKNRHNSQAVKHEELKMDNNADRTGSPDVYDNFKNYGSKGKPRSKSPEIIDEEPKNEAKIITFDTDSEEMQYKKVESENEIKINRLDFGSSSDDDLSDIISEEDTDGPEEVMFMNEHDVKFTNKD